MRILLVVPLALLVAAALPADDKFPDGKAAYNLDFAKPESLTGLVFSDPAVWKYGKDKDGKGCLELAYDRKMYKSSYNPKNRSPIHIALVAGKKFTDFTLDCELQSTTEPYGHQDMCVYFGFTEPQKFYYVHIAKAADMNAHNVFIVNDAARKNIAKETTKGVEWKKDTWHKVRVARNTATGTIEVFFDDMSKPIMKAEDKTFTSGYVGFGSFDDTGRIRNVRVSYVKAEDKKADFFKPLGKDKDK
jgi:hypothetical protein